MLFCRDKRLEAKEESLQEDIASLEDVLAQPQAASQAHEKQDRQVLYMVWYSLLRVVYVYYRT